VPAYTIVARSARQRRREVCRWRSALAHRDGFTREQRFREPQLGGAQESRVGRHGHPGLEHQHVTRHHACRIHLAPMPRPQQCCARRLERQQRVDGAACTPFRPEAEADVEHEYGRDHSRVGPFPHQEGEAGRGYQ
jgi:hypothetical protein